MSVSDNTHKVNTLTQGINEINSFPHINDKYFAAIIYMLQVKTVIVNYGTKNTKIKIQVFTLNPNSGWI